MTRSRKNSEGPHYRQFYGCICIHNINSLRHSLSFKSHSIQHTQKHPAMSDSKSPVVLPASSHALEKQRICKKQNLRQHITSRTRTPHVVFADVLCALLYLYLKYKTSIVDYPGRPSHLKHCLELSNCVLCQADVWFSILSVSFFILKISALS